MRHLIASLGVFGALCAAVISYQLFRGTVGNHMPSVYLINLWWGLYYGVGFEPTLIWYKIHGPYPTNILDMFAMVIYPILASALLYWIILKLSEPVARRKWIILALALSYLAVIPLADLQLERWWLPIFAFGEMMEPP